jgi:hypothetical protein
MGKSPDGAIQDDGTLEVSALDLLSTLPKESCVRIKRMLAADKDDTTHAEFVLFAVVSKSYTPSCPPHVSQSRSKPHSKQLKDT